jgi:acetyltransferase-like isoleucine patch superfamily enzyme
MAAAGRSGLREGKTMTDEEFIALVKRNAPFIANTLLHVARVYGDPSRIAWNSQYPPNDMLINVSSGRVEVAKDCFFGHTVMLLTGTHDVTKIGPERVTSYPKEGRDIVLEEGVWLASGVIVLGPSRIGKHAVVGAGSVVRGDIEPYAIYAGNIAKKIGQAGPQV